MFFVAVDRANLGKPPRLMMDKNSMKELLSLLSSYRHMVT